jgi:hypothetical protein
MKFSVQRVLMTQPISGRIKRVLRAMEVTLPI